MACARGYSGLIPEPLPLSQQQTPENHHFAKHRFTLKTEDDFTNTLTDQDFPQLPPPPILPPVDDTEPLIRRKSAELANSHDWDSQLNDQCFIAAPVTCFKHAPMSDIWENIMVGMKVEVENTDCDNVSDAFPDSFWVATVLKIVGYKALLRTRGLAQMIQRISGCRCVRIRCIRWGGVPREGSHSYHLKPLKINITIGRIF